MTAFSLITPIARRLDLEIGPGFQIGRYRGLNTVVHALVPTDYIRDIEHAAIEAGTIFLEHLYLTPLQGLCASSEKQHSFQSFFREFRQHFRTERVQPRSKLGVFPTASQSTAHPSHPCRNFYCYQQLHFPRPGRHSSTHTFPPSFLGSRNAELFPTLGHQGYLASLTTTTESQHLTELWTVDTELWSSQMTSFRLAHSLARRPIVRPRQPCTGKKSKARKASWGSGRVPSSSYDKLRNALADYLAQDDTSITPPAKDPKAPREPSDKPSRRPFDKAAHRPFDKAPRKPFASYDKAYTPIVPETDTTSSAADHKPYRKPYESYGKPSTHIAPKTETSSKEDIAPETYARDATDLCAMKFSAAGLFGIPKAKGPILPLRILFCGSDEFSCESLKALYAEHFRSRKLIRSIDVVVRPAKPTGRGLKEMREGAFSQDGLLP